MYKKEQEEGSNIRDDMMGKAWIMSVPAFELAVIRDGKTVCEMASTWHRN